MADSVYLTKEGHDELRKKLDYLVNVKRKEASERIKAARELGDLSENAEYDSAKDEQGIIEADIKLIEAQLERAIIIEETVDSKKDTRVMIGHNVTFHDYGDGDDYEYQIVGTTEADILQNRISNLSPLAKAMIGRKVGDKVKVTLPNDEYEIKILGIRV